MRIALLGLEKDFNPSAGRGPAVYIYNLYKNLSNTKNINVVKLNTRILNLLGNGIISQVTRLHLH